jgi:ADP-glucose pyrophosphorylase
LATSETAIAADVRMHPDARVRNSVLGANVEVASPIEIMNSVVFAGTRVESHATLDRAIITPLGLVDCRPLLDLSQTPGSQLPC